MYTDNEILFPHEIIPSLREMRGPLFQNLVERAVCGSQFDDETLAFMLMMIRLNGCVPCETDSFRAMRGCLACAAQTLRRYKGSDEDLVAAFDQALQDVRMFAESHPQYQICVLPLVPQSAAS
ncbi:MAG: hypothetical protein UZ15_CFX003001262 [Chloroflexi bacterium OLB15]|nr:MAG: hypothetical protein UZ15_CFX003001262 [Chloroflexi bacterium OLB15]